MKKKIICTIAALAMVMWTSIPAQAEFAGTLARDSDFTIEITNAISSTTTVTIYYLDRRGIDVIETMTVTGTDPTQETFPKPGRDVHRVIIEVDPSPSYQAALRIISNFGIAPITIEQGIRLVFNVV